MTILRFQPFGGLIPKADPSLLPAAAAQVAKNCRFSSGQLEAYNTPLEVYNPTMSNIQTIYRFGQTTNSDTDYWFTSRNVVNYVKGAIANDTEERTFYTGDGYPKVTKADMAVGSKPYPTNHYRLGLSAPALPIIALVTGTPTDESALEETRVYTYSFISVLGEESAPADASNEVTLRVGQTVSLMIGPPPSGAYNTSSKRIYRSVTGTNATDFLLVAEVSAAAGAFEDAVHANDLGGAITSIDFHQLPDLAQGLTAMPNGMLAAHTEYDVRFCEPFKPYAWPETYGQTVDFPIVGLGAFGNSLAVLTTGIPYVMTGSDPTSITVEKLPYQYACLSKKSICSAMGGVIFAAADGLVQISSAGPQVLTEALFTRREWQAFNPSSMMCCVWDERIFIFFRVSNEVKGCMILDSSSGLTTTDIYATAHFTDPVTGSLYLCVNDRIVKWDAGPVGQFQWKSRREVLPKPKNFGWGQVLATQYPVRFKTYADDGVTATVVVEGATPFRLPSGFHARYWEVELFGAGRVISALLADSSQELQSV